MPWDAGMITASAALVTAVVGALIGLMNGKQDGASITRQAVESAQSFWAETLAAQREEVDRLRARVEYLEETKRETDRLLDHVESLHSWIERGKRPPDPVRPSWLTPGVFSPLSSTPSPITPIDNP